MGFLDVLNNQVVVLDGAMGTMIQDLTLEDADFGGSEFRMLSDLLTFSSRDELKGIHLKYLQAGANAIETNTFGASRLRLQEYDFSHLNLEKFKNVPEGIDLKAIDYDEFAYHLNKQAAHIARLAIEEYKLSNEYDQRPLFVFGSIGPSNWVLSPTKANLNRGTYDDISQNFYEQTLGLIDGGADVLLFETQQDQLELKAGIHGAQRALTERNVSLPIVAQVTVDQFGKMQIFHTDIVAALTTIQDIGVDVFGINCSIGPEQMERTVELLGTYSRIPVSIIPNAGLPVSENGRTVFKATPDDLAGHLSRFVSQYGVNMVGGCCGTRPAHISAIREAVKNLTPKVRQIPELRYLSGPQNAIPLNSRDALIRIGERLNVRGSLKVRDAVEKGDIQFDVLEEVVNEQVSDLGLEVIDVCMDSNLVNTEETLVSVVQDVCTDFSGALCLDSFSVEALIRAIEVYPGKPIINSISLEEYAEGLDKVDAIVAKTYQHNPVYVALCTDASGPAVTAEDKAKLAKQIYEKCNSKYGVEAHQLIVDVNAFPIGSESEEGMNFAMESIKSIPMVKAIKPEIMVSMGVGNLTNGLAKKPYMRKVLTSVFMKLAREAGLDAAIINPHHYAPVESLDEADVQLALKVIQDRDMDAFEKLEEIAETKKGGTVKKRQSYDDLPVEQSICLKIRDGVKTRQAGTVDQDGFVYEYKDGIVPQVAEALKKHNPLEFINSHLMATMKDLGDGFGRGEVSLPHLLKSADVMKSAMGYIEAFMKDKSGVDVHEQITYKGTIVLGTVYQDVHSIGKDLVKTLFENYGYRVIDLGVQVPLDKFIDTAKEVNADAIGMSALLVQTSNHMITVAKKLKENQMNNVDILIGGAPVNQRHAAYVSMYGQENVVNQLSNVFYCPSGMDGVNVMNQLKESPEKRDEMCSQNVEKLRWQYEKAVLRSQKNQELLKTLPRRTIVFKNPGRESTLAFRSETVSMSLKDFKPYIDRKTLYSLNWRFGGKSSWEKKGTNAEKLDALLDEWIDLCVKNDWLVPQAVCGLLPCQSDGDEVLLFDPSDLKKSIGSVKFSVVIGAEKNDIFSAAQYYCPKHSGQYDLIGFQISTGGAKVDKQIEKFKDDGDSESALLLQGLSDRIAEDMAEYAHQYLRKRAAVDDNFGTRYSPGYPGLEDLAVNQQIADLMNAKSKLGISLTEAGEFYPTGTTGAVVCFHSQARYD